jgi:hypothetical protein
VIPLQNFDHVEDYLAWFNNLPLKLEKYEAHFKKEDHQLIQIVPHNLLASYEVFVSSYCCMKSLLGNQVISTDFNSFCNALIENR